MTRDRLLRDIARELMFAERTKDIFENFCWPEGMTREDKQQAVQEAKQIRICPMSGLDCCCRDDLALYCHSWARTQGGKL